MTHKHTTINNTKADQKNPTRVLTGVAFFLIFAGALARLLPHEPNFTPLAAIALFSGTYLFHHKGIRQTIKSSLLSNRINTIIQNIFPFAVPLAALVLSDFFIGFYNPIVMVFVYGSFVLSIFIGRLIRTKITASKITIGSLIGSIQFYLLTNFAVWLIPGSLYSKTLDGLIASYVAGIPFFRNTIMGDLFYVGVIFGSYALATKGVRYFQDRKQAIHAPQTEKL